MRKRIVSTTSLLAVIVCMAFIVFFINQSVASANITTGFYAIEDTTIYEAIYATEDTTIVYEGINADKIYEVGNLGYLDVGYKGTLGVPLEVQVLLKFNLPPTPEGYEFETANLYLPVTGGTFQGITDFSLKVSTSTNHSWIQDSAITSPPAPTSGSTQTRLLANSVAQLKPTLAPFGFTSYISGEFTKADPRATFILSGMTAQEAAQAGIPYSDHYIQMTENHMYDGSLGPYLIITYSEIANIEITGVTDGGLYNTNVTPQFNVGTATLNGNPFTSGTRVTAEGSYTLRVTAGSKTETIQFRIDKTPPTGTVIVNLGNQYTNNTAVSVSITPAVGVNDLTHIQYSVNGNPFTQMPYVPSFMLAVGATNGDKVLFFKLVDGAGNESPEYQRIITLDTVAPTGSVVINNGNAYTTNRDVTLNLSLDSGVTDVVGVQFSSDDRTWTAVEAFSSTKSYTLSVGDGNKTVYVRFIDHVDNIGSAQDSIILDMTAPIVTGVADGESYNSSRTITFDEGTATLNGKSFINGSPVDDEGSYILVVTDAAGNSTTITFSIFKYRVNYDGNGATGGIVPIDSQTYETGDGVTVANNTGNLVRTGYTFKGWNTEADGNGTSYAANEAFNISAANVTLYAMWDANHYTVTFESNGGSVVATQNKSFNETATEPSAPTKSGYTFGGWYKELTLTNQWIFTKDLVTANTTLYAKWIGNSSSGSSGSGGGGYIPTTPQNSTVYFETNGGYVIVNLSVENNSRLAELPTPTKEGFTFEGWYKDVALTKKWDLLTDRVTKNIKLYAKWIVNTSPDLKPGQESTPDGTELPVVSFDDISGHWAKGMIEELSSRGIITGYPDGSFHPNQSIQRQHMALIFMRAFELEPTREAVIFSDVSSSHPYYEAITSLQQAGIVDGANGRFNSNEPVTRAQMAKTVAHALKIKPGGTSTFQDVPMAHWSYNYIAALADLEIVLGDKGKFKPNEPVTRAEFVAMMYRALNLTK
ncbi:InlB B-repeat-containing protein [Paenibacillus segetis]|uniref:SLH domain-containing protein n=1 Tax=Paenibacillus segetis TaxID=1325360 RepID=A0ABQ1Y2B9_9BACL|nr:InlB B-repeat-containing protein [Paenibacillus segetis]GGH10198.1 hypothetical protein GCM10008013_01550 [Paenibacillus segetis]